MLKQIITISLVCMGSLCSLAQNDDSTASAAKVTTKDVMSYSRNSLTVIPVTGMTQYDGIVLDWAKHQDFEGKFDYNDVSVPKIGKLTKNSIDSIGQILLQHSVPKRVVDYWIQYDGKLFKTDILEKRSVYNATDADVLQDRAAKVASLQTHGRELMKNSFLLVAGPTVVTSSTDKKGNVTYSAKSTGFVYHIDLNDEVLETIWQNWLDEESTPEQKMNYDNMVIGLESTATVSGAHGVGSPPKEAIHKSLTELFEKLEKKVDKWQVVTSVYQLHPIGAKIGTKERLKNSDRYAIFRVVEDEDGELKYKRTGYVRATEIADNSFDATGESPCSNFYQISGRKNAKEGMFLKQSKDARISLSISGNFLDSYAVANFDVDYLIHTSQKLGMMQYGGISVGFDGGDNIYGDKATWLPIGLHYGVGLHLTRWFELQPNIGVGADIYGSEETLLDSDNDDESFMKKIAYFAHGGVKFGFQVWYPVQLFVRADYSAKFGEGEYYVSSDKKRFGFSLGAGIRINF